MKKIIQILNVLAICFVLPYPVWANLDEGLVGYWPFNGNAFDESGNGNNGTVHGALLTRDRFGNANSAYGFNKSDYIEVPHSSALDITKWTLSGWFMSFSDQIAEIVDREPNSHHNYQIQLGTDHPATGLGRRTDLLELWYEDSFDDDYFVISTTEFENNKWYHFGGTYDGFYLTLYINGDFDNQKITTVTPQTGTAPLWFGKGNHGFFHGIIDDIRIYNRALSENEIKTLNLICGGDFDTDGDVDGSDLAVFAADFGRIDCGTGQECEGDFDGNGDVDESDLAVFAADFGRTDCP